MKITICGSSTFREELAAGKNPGLWKRILNFTKNNMENYIGSNTLMEMGFAHVHDKKIFLLNPVPEVGSKDEILAMEPIVLHDDLNKIGDLDET